MIIVRDTIKNKNNRYSKDINDNYNKTVINIINPITLSKNIAKKNK